MNKKICLLFISIIFVLSTITFAGCIFDEETISMDKQIVARETNDAFNITALNGQLGQNDKTFFLNSSGVYTLSGRLEGQIVVQAQDNEKVEINLNGVTIINSNDSPIKIISAKKVEISAKKGTENVIKDTRNPKTQDDATLGEGAISGKADIELKGKGVLVVSSTYNNGIHTTKDLKIKNLSLKVTARNNAIKAKDGVKMESGTVVAISTHGDGIETKNTDKNSNNVVRGDVRLLGVNVWVFSAGDAFQVAHNFVMEEDENGISPSVQVFTGAYSSYTASDANTTSYKGVKVQNEINISSGTITLKTFDDGLHADYGKSLQDSTVGQGTINISGGTIIANTFAPKNKTAKGKTAPSGWDNQKSIIGTDAIHADYKIIVSGGIINIDSSYEGLEANVVDIRGGNICIFSNDDGINACTITQISSPSTVQISGGYVDITVAPDADTDGIDSNGSYLQTGGVVVVRGPNGLNETALDARVQASIQGGTIVIIGSVGEKGIKTNGLQTYELSLYTKGSHTLVIDGVSYTFANMYKYATSIVYSSYVIE